MGSPGPQMTSCVIYGVEINLDVMFARSVAAISETSCRSHLHRKIYLERDSRLAASNRNPSTPRESKSLAYSAKRSLTYSSVSVARLPISLSVQPSRQAEEYVLSQTYQLAGLYFEPIVVIDDVIIGFKSAIMEVLRLICAGIDVVRVWRSCNTDPRTTRHVVEDSICQAGDHYCKLQLLLELPQRELTSDDLHTGCMAGRDHIGELGAIPPLRSQDARDWLIIRPPLGTN
jgi:hypothetical protein